MTYEETVNTINNIRRFGNLSGAEITACMLEQLGHPERGIDMIHIAGTNGKGSVSAFLCEILKQTGKKVGVFTSPHLVDFRERICVNKEMITKEAVTRIGNKLLDTDFGVSPTMFDYCVAMAVLYFQEQNCDVIIWETGLGGRCDSTNALGIPDVTIITKIGYDHMAILGNTLTEIAGEKAGIIKKGTRLVTESQDADVLNVLRRASEAAGVTSFFSIEPAALDNIEFTGKRQYFSYGKYGTFHMKMLGAYQCENAAAAILAADAYLEKIQENGSIEISDTQKMEWIHTGIEQTLWKGRMEILSQTPFLLVDGAHNSDGVAALKNSLVQLFPDEKFHFIMGVMADKDYEEMVEVLLPLALDFTTVTVESKRALQAEVLAAYIQKRGVSAKCASIFECLKMEKDWTEKTVAFGSLYFIGEIEAFFC